MFILILGLGIFGFKVANKKKKESNKARELIQDFENKMNDSGFKKRIVVYDFLPEFEKKMADISVKQKWTNCTKHWWMIGIWLNYEKRSVVLRPDGDVWDDIEIPFDKIRDVQITENAYAKTSGGAIGYGSIAVGSATTKEHSKGLYVRIVTGDINGTNTYNLKLHEQQFGSRNKLSNYYEGVTECARLIEEEIRNIIRYAEKH